MFYVCHTKQNAKKAALISILKRNADLLNILVLYQVL